MTRREALGTMAAGTAMTMTGLSAEKDSAGGRLKQGTAIWCFRKVPFDKLCEEAAKMGLHGFDLASPQQWETMKKHGLICTMVSSHSIGNGLSEPKNHEKCLASLTKSIESCAKEGFPNVITFSGNRRGRSDEEGLKNCVDALKKIAPLAEKKKVMINLEFLNSKVNHKDYMADSTEWCVELVKQVGSPYVKVLYDIYHAGVEGEDCVADIKKHYECWGHYHTAGVPGRHEIDDGQTLDYPAIAKAVADTKFKGYFIHEFSPGKDRDPIESLKQAVKICTV